MTQDERPTQDDRYTPARVKLFMMADDSIREMIAFDDISAYATANQKDIKTRWMRNHLPLMSSASAAEFSETARRMVEAIMKAADRAEDNTGDKSEKWVVSVPEGDAGAAFHAAMTAAVLGLADHTQITSRAFLIAAESSFEVLFGQVARVVYEKHPEALPKSDHSFTLEELASYGTIDDARDALLVKKIEGLLRESPDDWSKWLKRTVGLSMDQIIPEWPQVREIFTRRNMLVHTDSNITARYLAEVKRAGGSTDGLEVGQSLIPTPDYLKTALQQLIALEALLTCKVVSHIDKQEADEAAAWLAGRLEWAIHKEMWDAACLISDSFDDARCKRSTQLKIRVNGWLAHKNREGISRIRDDVIAWDVSGLSEEYGMLRKALLDELTEEEVRTLLDGALLTRFEVLTNPLYSNIRQWITLADPEPSEG
jgi:hypothetical protein